jgi:uncharacterized protein
VPCWWGGLEKGNREKHSAIQTTEGRLMMAGKPSEREEEYFARMEFEQKKKTEEARQKQMAEGEKKMLKELHYMKCPKCGMELIEIDYKGITVDKCSGCAGIWFDAGEVEAVSHIEKKGFDGLFAVFKK